jgi:hypothetical protein
MWEGDLLRLPLHEMDGAAAGRSSGCAAFRIEEIACIDAPKLETSRYESRFADWWKIGFFRFT